LLTWIIIVDTRATILSNDAVSKVIGLLQPPIAPVPYKNPELMREFVNKGESHTLKASVKYMSSSALDAKHDTIRLEPVANLLFELAL
jgi:hypothetical protein